MVARALLWRHVCPRERLEYEAHRAPFYAAAQYQTNRGRSLPQQKALRAGPRSGHHQFARDRFRPRRIDPRRRTTGIHADLSRSRAGSSTTRRKSGRPSRACSPRCWRRRDAPAELAAIGITNQRETTVVWDRATGEPVVQRDRVAGPPHRRASATRCARAGYEETFTRKTGCCSIAYFSGTKIRWLLDNVPGARARAERGELAFGTVDSWLVWNSPAVRCTSPTPRTRAARCCSTSTRGDWDDELLELLDVPRAMLPAGRPVVGRLRASRLVRGVGGCRSPGIAGDQHAALFGQACFEPGHGEEHLRHRLLPADEYRRTPVASKNNLLTTVAWQSGDKHRLCAGRQRLHRRRRGAMAARRPGIIKNAAEIEALAASVPTAAACISCPRSPVSARRTGTRTRAARCSA